MPNFEIIQGDCLEALKKLETNSACGVVTDPPYASGARQQAGARTMIAKNDRANNEWFLGDNMGSDSYIWWMRSIANECLRVCQPGAHAYVFTDWRQYHNLVTAWETMRWTLKSVLVWDKNRAGAMGTFWRSNHEWVAIFSKGAPYKLPHHSFFNTWQGSKPACGVHPTEKPVGLLSYITSALPTDKGPIIDPFAGSGSTGVACMTTGHDFIGIEAVADYCELATERITAKQKELANFAKTAS